MLNRRTGCVMLFGVWLAACGGDDSGPGTLKTSVDGSKRVDMLSSTDSAQICKDFETFATDAEKSFKPKLCRLAGLLAGSLGSSDKATCEKAVSDCIAEPSDTTNGGMCEIGTDCKATVAEVQKCVNDTFAQLGTYLDQLPTCSQIADGSGKVPATEPAQPASCKAIATTCPDIADFGDAEEGFDQ